MLCFSAEKYLSVRLSVTMSIVSKRLNLSSKFFHYPDISNINFLQTIGVAKFQRYCAPNWGLKHSWGIEVWAFTELFAWFKLSVINNVDDGLLISLAVTCDQTSAAPSDSDLWYMWPPNGRGH